MIRFGADLPLGKYYIQEITAAEGYEYDGSIIEVDTTELDSSEKEYQVKVEKENKQTEIKVVKAEKIEEPEEEIQEEAETLEEINPKIKTIENEQEEEQQEEADEGEETLPEEDEEGITIIEGATMQILEKETEEVVREWTTEAEATVIKKLKTETEYILHEKEPAPGYVTSEDITFSLTKEGELITEEGNKLEEQENTLVMYDDVTKVEIHFVDEITKEQLPGGELEIINEEGEVVATITTEEESWKIEKLPIGEYIVITTKVPEGYDSAEEIKLIVKDTPENQEVTIEVKRKPFDLSVEKYISKVTVNGETVLESGYENKDSVKKVEINRKQVNTANVIVEYTIRIINSGEIDGTIGKVTDTLPGGLEFIAEQNESYWEVNGQTISTERFAEEEIKAGENVEIKVVARWTNTSFGELTNTVKIENANNKFEFEDINPGNDEGESSVIIAVGTGREGQMILNIMMISAIAGIIIYTIIKQKKKQIK